MVVRLPAHFPQHTQTPEVGLIRSEWCVITAAGFSGRIVAIVCGVIEMFMECLFIYISMTWNIHIRFRTDRN